VQRLALSLLLLSIVAVWGWTFVVVKDAIDDYGVVPFLAVRFTIGLFCVGIFAVRRANWPTLRTGGLIGIVLAAAYLFQTFGLDLSTATNTGLITGLFIIFVPLANRLVFRVRTSRMLWGAIGVSLFGLVLLTTGAGAAGLKPGDPLTLGCAACFGLHIALLDRHSKHHRAGVLVLGQLVVATLLFWAVCLPTGMPGWPCAKVWFALLITGVIATAAGFYVQVFVQQRLSAVETAIIILTEPIFAAVFGYLLADERLTWTQICGAILMVAAVFAVEIHSQFRNGRRVDTRKE
jgi:drug/metabolite transporter (DMT)-like permease